MRNLESTTRTSPYPRLVVFAGIAVLALLATAVWHTSGPVFWERPIITVLQAVPAPLRDFWIAMFEPIPFALTVSALGFTAAARGRTRLAVAGVFGCVFAVLTTELLFKPLVDRVRIEVVGVHHRLAHIGGPMFPSAHVTAATAFATFAWLILDRRSRLTPLLVALPLVVGWAAISKGMHYPADVAGGIIVGSTVVYCTVAAARAAARWIDGAASDADTSLEPRAVLQPRDGEPARV